MLDKYKTKFKPSFASTPTRRPGFDSRCRTIFGNYFYILKIKTKQKVKFVLMNQTAVHVIMYNFICEY